MRRTKPPAPQTGSADDVEVEFYEAMQRGDIERLMGLWSDDDEISCVHPGGPRRLDTHSTAVHSVLERVRVPGAEGDAFAWVVATNVYVKATSGWRLVAHHASPGTASEVPEVAETASVLH
jgi:ketosteroid isomerase-like protein